MAERALYCHPIDVLRKYDPTLTAGDLDSNDYIGNEDRQQVRARIDAVGNTLEDQTGHAYRLQRMGSPGAPETYEHQGVMNERSTEPMWASLARRPVLPFDSNQGDTLEVRTGKDSWEDVTDDAGDEFVLDHRTGRLKLYRWLVRKIHWGAPDDRYLRATYRYGALGGDPLEGGQTTLDGSITNSATSISVANAARLPSDGVLLVGNSEYVRLTGVTHSTDTLTVARGVQASDADSHGDGDVVHYAPEGVREAVAAKAARELLRYEDWVDNLVDASNVDVGAAEKMQSWQDSWEQMLASNSDVRRM